MCVCVCVCVCVISIRHLDVVMLSHLLSQSTTHAVTYSCLRTTADTAKARISRVSCLPPEVMVSPPWLSARFNSASEASKALSKVLRLVDRDRRRAHREVCQVIDCQHGAAGSDDSDDDIDGSSSEQVLLRPATTVM